MSEPDAGLSDSVERFKFVLPARLEYRDAARTFLGFVCDRLVASGKLDAEAPVRVSSAFVEAFNNAVIHAYDRRPEPIEIELEVGTKRLALRLIDSGVGFRLDDVPTPDFEKLPEGGMGIYIMRSFMDRVRFSREGSKNVLTLEKDLRTPEG
ncbi:MAG: ATP-binding protein [Deltaproteobacteria bacterium]|nr:ATP-binding protein [Deltaproteobacteria bacterium]